MKAAAAVAAVPKRVVVIGGGFAGMQVSHSKPYTLHPKP